MRPATVSIALAMSLGRGPPAPRRPPPASGRIRCCPHPKSSLLPTVKIATAEGWAAGREADRGRGPRGDALRRRPRPPALALRAAQRRRARRGDQRAAEGERGRQGLGHEAGHEEGRRRRRRAPTASRCCATPTATAWPRPASSSSRACTRRSAWRWSATTFYVANTDAVVRFPYQDGQTADHGAQAPSSPICRPGRSTITGPRT